MPELPTIELEDRPERASDHELIDEAPADYNLHRLKPDQSLINWASPYLLAGNSVPVIEVALTAQAASGLPLDSVVAIDISEQEPMVLQQWDHKQAGIEIDGRLDEAAWREAMAISQLRVTEPDTLMAPAYDLSLIHI